MNGTRWFSFPANATFLRTAGYKAIDSHLIYYGCNFQFTSVALDLEFFQILLLFLVIYRRNFILQQFYSNKPNKQTNKQTVVFFLQMKFYPAFRTFQLYNIL